MPDRIPARQPEHSERIQAERRRLRAALLAGVSLEDAADILHTLCTLLPPSAKSARGRRRRGPGGGPGQGGLGPAGGPLR